MGKRVFLLVVAIGLVATTAAAGAAAEDLERDPPLTVPAAAGFDAAVTVTRQRAVAGAAFRPYYRVDGADMLLAQHDWCSYLTDGSAWAGAAVEGLPVGATITEVRAKVYDHHTNDPVISLLSTAGDGVDLTTHSTVTDNGLDGYGDLVDGSITDPVVEEGRFYFLDWGARSDDNPSAHRICGVQISYEVEVPAPFNYTPVTPCSVYDTRPGQYPLDVTTPFVPGETRLVTVENDTNGCGVVGTAPDGFVITVLAIGGTGNGSVKVWPNGRAEPAAGGALAFSTNDRAPAVTLFVEELGYAHDLVVKVLKSSADIKIVVTGYWDHDLIPRIMD